MDEVNEITKEYDKRLEFFLNAKKMVAKDKRRLDIVTHCGKFNLDVPETPNEGHSDCSSLFSTIVNDPEQRDGIQMLSEIPLELCTIVSKEDEMNLFKFLISSVSILYAYVLYSKHRKQRIGINHIPGTKASLVLYQGTRMKSEVILDTSHVLSSGLILFDTSTLDVTFSCGGEGYIPIVFNEYYPRLKRKGKLVYRDLYVRPNLTRPAAECASKRDMVIKKLAMSIARTAVRSENE